MTPLDLLASLSPAEFAISLLGLPLGAIAARTATLRLAAIKPQR